MSCRYLAEGNTEMKETPRQPTRRGFLDWVIGLFSAVTVGAMGIPALAYFWPAARGGKGGDVEVQDAAKLKPGESMIVQLQGKAAIVRRDSTGLVAHSAVCTHLGCLVKWDGARKEFLCPCHAAVFDSSGRVVSGPAPAPLPTYKVKEVGDKVFVSAS
jgi:cytochrome b6-f complex iron-sulfur subunit